ncbi:RNA-binding protein 34 [Macadamia integrifolia]|uniref:RNA-binding protein 34 n=1 Tax=Macadamia integrifolia TaxID=60698 RepID=UPI001C4EC453|nr:RNA-binding protein 34 [Macadamia integrifolia]
MGKKLKEKTPKEDDRKDEVTGSTSDIFKTLLGNTSEEGGFSLFTCNNPFRRKPDQQQIGLGFSSAEASQNPKTPNPDNDGDSQIEPKKRKRHKEKKLNVDAVDESVGNGDSENLEENKRKKSLERNPSSDVYMVGNGTIEEDSKDGLHVEKEKKKKKRKRDEVEEEYERRNYGVVEKDESEKVGLGKRVVGEKRKKMDDPGEVLVSKEGFDDESKLLRTVFAGNLPLKVKKKALLKEFSRFGEIESLRIRSVPLLDSKIPRKGAILKGKINEAVNSVHAYIVFKDEQAARSSLAHNMAVVGGNHIRVDMACPPRKKLKGETAGLYDRKKTVFVGNLPFDVKDEELYKLFCGINQLDSSIEAVRVIRDPHTSMGKGIAYVLFKTREAANMIVKKKSLKLRNRDLRLCHAKSDSTPLKKRNASPVWKDGLPSKRLAVTSGENSADGNIMPKAKAYLSYQGLRASKAGVQKKMSFSPRTFEQGKFQSKRQNGPEKKVRETKRPSVAARKRMALATKDGVVPKQIGNKRKLGSTAPGSSPRNKKARKIR